MTTPTLQERLQDPRFLAKLNEYQDLAGYQSPTTQRITYNKVVGKSSFAMFTDIIAALAPLELILDPEQQHKLPSMAQVLKKYDDHVAIYPIYLCMNANLDEFMDYETEEDQENLDALFEEVDALPKGTPMIGLAIHKSEAMQSAHASAFIVWRVGKAKYKFAFYDPLAYFKGKTKSYDFAERSYDAKRFEQKIEFVNLHQYCYHKAAEEFHCVQYVINAEYCYLLSVYFLKCWIELGKSLTDFRGAVEAAYIVEPSKLTRNDNRESMIFRVVMMAFLCKSLKIYLKDVLKKKHEKWIGDRQKMRARLEAYEKQFEERYGFPL